MGTAPKGAVHLRSFLALPESPFAELSHRPWRLSSMDIHGLRERKRKGPAGGDRAFPYVHGPAGENRTESITVV